MKNIDLSKLTDLGSFYNEFNNESSRGMVIIAYANLEACLQKLLENYFQKNSSEIKRLFEKNLTTFYEKNLLAYELKLIRRSIYHDLDIVRQIRNEFAHEMYGLTFDDEAIRKLCDQLGFAKLPSYPLTQTPENKFIFTCSILNGFLLTLLQSKRSIH